VLWCLHGFLGSGSDWDGLRASWPTDLPPLHTPDLFASPPRDASLSAFGERLSTEVAAVDPAPLLLGYSLGGRLALHALLARPTLWRGVVIVSAHLGLSDRPPRAARLDDDAAWARRFREEPWAALMRDWNARDVFGGREPALPREESRFDRAALAHALDAWSLGRQDDLAPRLATLTVPILWIAGADDRRYVTQGQRAARAAPTIRFVPAPGAAHRVPWEAAEWFRETVTKFVRELTDRREPTAVSR
jgi:2-succinyl-6-hydroxy-2,4-cyclohexadiene-1-carboxylate synthase